MIFNLAKALVMPYERQRKPFPASSAIMAMVNARIDRLLQEYREQVRVDIKAQVSVTASGEAGHGIGVSV